MFIRTYIVSALKAGCLSILLLGLTGLISAQADQTDPQLESLFDALREAQSNSEAQRIEGAIWQIWLDAPTENATYLLSQVSAAMSAGQHQLALQISNQLVDSSPDYAEAWNKRATIQYLLGNHGQSVADIKETLILEPRHFGALSGLGLIFMSSGNFEAALDAFSRVLQISPSSANARGSIARVQSLIGDEV